MYLTEDQYREYGGDLDSAEFGRYEYAAERTVRNYTFGRVDRMAEVPEAVRRLMYELIHVALNASALKTADTVVKSFNSDGYSESYSSTVTSLEDVDKLNEELIRQYLLSEEDDNGVPLLYIGADMGVGQ